MKVNINVPELHEIPLRWYQEYLTMCHDDEGQYVFSGTNKDIVRIFTRQSDEVIDRASKAQVDQIANMINQHLSVECDLVKTFNFKGRTWGFIPNLDKISWGENRDANEYLGDWQQIHKTMAVLYRPVTNQMKGKYLIEKYEGSAKYEDVLRDMPLNVVFGAMVFFCNLLSDLLKATPDYILKQLTPEQREMAVSLENGETTTKSQYSVQHLIAIMKAFTKQVYTPVT